MSQDKIMLKHAKNQVKRFLKALRRYYFNPWRRHIQQPFVLLLGNTASGKSKLIERSELGLLNATLDDNTGLHTLHETVKFGQWWCTQEAVFIEMSSLEPDDLDLPKQHAYFRTLFRTLKRYRFGHPLERVVLVLNTQTMIDDPDAFKKTLQCLERDCNLIEGISGTLQITLLLTHLDQLRGFSAFFDDIGPEARHQPWGVEVAASTEPGQEHTTFELGFQQLLERLNQRVMLRMRQENQLIRRQAICTFPMQIEALRTRLEDSLQHFTWTEDVRLTGIYLSSSVQNGQEAPVITHPFSAIESSSNHSHSARMHHQVGYFTQGLLSDLGTTEHDGHASSLRKAGPKFTGMLNAASHTLAARRIAMIVLAVSLILGSAIHEAVKHATHFADQIHKNLPKAKRHQRPLSMAKAVQLEQLTEQEPSTWLRFVGLSQAHKASTQLHTLYQDRLQHKLLPALTKTVGQIIDTRLEAHKPDFSLYQLAQVYLDLSGDDQAQGEAKPWLMQHLQLILNNPAFSDQKSLTQNTLRNLIKDLFSTALPKRHASQDRLDAIKAKLHKLSPEQAVLLYAQSQDSSHDAENIRLPSALFQLPILTIPTWYTASGAQDFIERLADTAAAYEPDAFLPKIREKTLSGHRLQTKMRKRFMAQYSAFWAEQLAQLTPAATLLPDDMIEALDTLSEKSDSELAQLLSALHFTAQESDADTDDFSSQNEHILDQLTSIADSDNPEQSAYDWAKKQYTTDHPNIEKIMLGTRLKSTDENLTTRFQVILVQMAWRSLMNLAKKQIETAWETSVLDSTNHTLQNCFPLDAQSTEDCSSTDFKTLFAPSGAVETFFHQWLSPFTEKDDQYWAWKMIDGQSIGLSRQSTEFFLRAKLIQSMFFGQNGDYAQYRFSIIPLELARTIRDFAFEVDGKIIHFDPNNQPMQQIRFSTANHDSASLAYLDGRGEPTVLRFNGPWAMLRLIHTPNITLTPISGRPHRYTLTILENDQTIASFRLIVESTADPLIPDIVAHMTLNTTL